MDNDIGGKLFQDAHQSTVLGRHRANESHGEVVTHLFRSGRIVFPFRKGGIDIPQVKIDVGGERKKPKSGSLDLLPKEHACVKTDFMPLLPQEVRGNQQWVNVPGSRKACKQYLHSVPFLIKATLGEGDSHQHNARRGELIPSYRSFYVKLQTLPSPEQQIGITR
ncbi:hypothetical protein HNQ77_004315 [Silvibacterium bohemicum]|uniref:Uncharacterized protein n=1 Tax=Silvibacterium bohemicum TaxID=1577686 RepID=A0A841JY28_9BACT|nr:hypothetical protein [Silvibacterium bohemicum]